MAGLLDLLSPGSDGGLLDFLKANANAAIANTPTGAPGDMARYGAIPQQMGAGVMPGSVPGIPMPMSANPSTLQAPAISNASLGNGPSNAPLVDTQGALPGGPLPQMPTPAGLPAPSFPGASGQPGFMTGYENLKHGGGLIGSIMAGITGQRNDTAGIQQQNLGAQFQALRQTLQQGGLSPQAAASRAMLLLMNPGAAKLSAPVVVPEGGTAVDPNTGQVIGRGQPRSYSVPPGGALVTPGGTSAPSQNAPNGSAPAAASGNGTYENTNGLLTDQAARFAAQRLASGDKSALSQIGRGTIGNLNAARIANMLPTLGLTPQQLNLAQAELGGLNAGEAALGKQDATLGRAAVEAGNAIQLARGAINNVSRVSGAGPFNLTINQLKQGYAEHALNPAQTELYTRAQAVINTYATVMTRGGAPTDSARAHATELLNTAGNAQTWNRALETLQSEIDLAKNSPDQMKQLLRQQYLGQSPTSGQPNAPKMGQRPLPQGYTPQMVVTDAKQAWATASPAQRSAMAAKAAAHGVNLSQYGLH